MKAKKQMAGAGVAAVALILAAGAARGAITWTDGAAGNSNWSDAGNWSGALSDLARVFNDTAVGASDMNVSPSLSITKLTYANTAGTNTLDLGGNTLTIANSGLAVGEDLKTASAVIRNGSLQLGSGTVRIGYGNNVSGAPDAGGVVTLDDVAFATTGLGNVHVGYTYSSGQSVYYQVSTGVWDMSQSHGGVFVKSGGGEFEIGSRRQWPLTASTRNEGAIRFGDNWAITIGTAASPTQFRVGRGGHAELTAGQGGSFTGYLSGVEVGMAGNATLDFSGITNGYMLLSGAGAFGTGVGRSTAVTLGSNWTINITGNGIQSFGHDGATTTFVAPNLTLYGTCQRFYVGTGPAGSGTGGTGSLEVASLGSGLQSGHLWVGANHANSRGTLTLPAGKVTIAAGSTATIGSNGGIGTLHLNGTDLVVSNTTGTALAVGAGSRVNVNVGAVSCGPELIRDHRWAVELSGTTASGSGLMITFTRNPVGPQGRGLTLGDAANHDGIFYGFKWAGNRSATTDRELGWLINNDRVKWDDTALTGPFADAVGMFYDADSNATYIGCYVRTPKGTLISIR